MLMETDPPPITRLWTSSRICAICGSKAIGINFGVPTCAPCKAFFRRNARKREVLQVPCQLIKSDLYVIDENNTSGDCPQLRRCTACRLRRCYDAGMKEELVRTDEEKKRYKQLIEINRQRRQQVVKSQTIPSIIFNNDPLLEEKDWRFLSNIVSAYDNYCLKLFTDNRKIIFDNRISFPEQSLAKINHHVVTRINVITSFLSFLTSIPIVQTLSTSNRLYLCKHNIRPLLLPNLHEIEQTCFTESYQAALDDTAAEYVYGTVIYHASIQIKNRARSILINDPVVTRLWLLVLFFSTPLYCYYDDLLPNISSDNQLEINKIQNVFINLLWNYLLHRHGYCDSIRIFSNFIKIYLDMQRISRAINHQVRTRKDLIAMHQAFNRAIVLERDL